MSDGAIFYSDIIILLHFTGISDFNQVNIILGVFYGDGNITLKKRILLWWSFKMI